MLFNKGDKTIVIMGDNKITVSIARILSKNNDVVLISKDPLLLENNRALDVEFIVSSNKGLFSIMDNIGFKKSDIFLSLTASDEFNLFASYLAKNKGADKTVSLVNNNSYLELEAGDWVDLIFNPNQILTDLISVLLKDTRLINIKNLIPGKVDVTQVTVTPGDKLSYLKIKNIDFNNGIIVAIKRGNKYIFPDPELPLYPDDRLFILYKRGMVSKLLKNFIKKRHSKKKIFILGGNKLSVSLVKAWEGIYKRLIIIEPDLNQCNHLAEKLEDILILHGNGVDLNLLREEGLDKDSIYVGSSLGDLSNILGSYIAMKTGCTEVVTVLHNPVYKGVANILGLKMVISLPEQIAKYVSNYLSSGEDINPPYIWR